jgi:hypothetical protein
VKTYICVEVDRALVYALVQQQKLLEVCPTFWLLLNKLALEYVSALPRGRTPGEAANISFYLPDLVQQLDTTEEKLFEAVAKGASVVCEANDMGLLLNFVGLWTAVRWPKTDFVPEEIRFHLSPAFQRFMRKSCTAIKLPVPENEDWCSRILAADLAAEGSYFSAMEQQGGSYFDAGRSAVGRRAIGSACGLCGEVLEDWVDRWHIAMTGN